MGGVNSKLLKSSVANSNGTKINNKAANALV